MSIEQINKHYAERHTLRQGIFGEKPYSNYGYWDRPGMTIDEAGDAMAELVARAAGMRRGDRILECGSGYAASAVHYTRLFEPAEVIALDATTVRVEEAQEYVRKCGLAGRISVRLGDALHTGLPAASFDRVLAMECAFHFQTRRDFLGEAFRVLKPGGVLVITDIIQSAEIKKTNPSRERMRLLLGADQKKIMDENIYDAEVYAGHLRDAGFGEIRITSIKDKVIPPFADHLERVAHASDPERRRNRLAAAESFRTDLMVGGDYVLVTAVKPVA
jgi:cyclopropane fatty-acyl-phospholipid synthase-like methyltransferase